MEQKYRNMWQYSAHILKDIGMRGVFAGWGVSVAKDTLGFGIFFSTFEYIKAQACYKFLAMYYGDLGGDLLAPILKPKVVSDGAVEIIKPHYAIEPTFLAMAGVTASLAQQIIAHPLTRVQDIHHRSLTELDRQARMEKSKTELYRKGYEKTLQKCAARAKKAGGWRVWLYKGFWWNTIRQVPSTAAGLVIFELVRKKYANEAEAVRIEEDGYDILLT